MIDALAMVPLFRVRRDRSFFIPVPTVSYSRETGPDAGPGKIFARDLGAATIFSGFRTFGAVAVILIPISPGSGSGSEKNRVRGSPAGPYPSPITDRGSRDWQSGPDPTGTGTRKKSFCRFLCE